MGRSFFFARHYHFFWLVRRNGRPNKEKGPGRGLPEPTLLVCGPPDDELSRRRLKANVSTVFKHNTDDAIRQIRKPQDADRKQQNADHLEIRVLKMVIDEFKAAPGGKQSNDDDVASKDDIEATTTPYQTIARVN